MQRRSFITAALALLAGSHAFPAWARNTEQPMIEVWKTPTCGCCKDWIAHLQRHGFEVRAHDVSDAVKNDFRRRLGLQDRLGSCHTALVGSYVLEGHVPAREIQRLLRERPRALGLTVPGMPVGAPGMDAAEYGGLKDPYDVLLVQRDGRSTTIYQSYR